MKTARVDPNKTSTEAPELDEVKSIMFDKLLFQNQNSLDFKDKYVPDHQEAIKFHWSNYKYL